MLRWALFMVSSGVLVALAVRAALVLRQLMQEQANG